MTGEAPIDHTIIRAKTLVVDGTDVIEALDNIPQGEQGEQGEKGEKGDKGDQGPPVYARSVYAHNLLYASDERVKDWVTMDADECLAGIVSLEPMVY